MKSTPVFVIGPPAVGKTTLMRAVLAQCLEELATEQRLDAKDQGKAPPPYPVPLVYSEEDGAKWTLVPQVAAFAGHYTGHPFDGADRISYSGALDALKFWRQRLDHVSARIRSVVCVPGRGPGHPGPEHGRAGEGENPSWVKGRVTKCQNFAARFRPERLLRLVPWDAKESAFHVLKILRTGSL